MSEEPRPARPQVPADMKAFNRALIAEHRANQGRLSGDRARMTVLLLTTTGRKTAQPVTVVLGYGKDGDDRYVVIASANGAPDHPHWYKNLQANSVATVEVGAEKFPVRARTARPDEKERLTPKVPYVVSQQKLTEREIPIVVLQRLRD